MAIPAAGSSVCDRVLRCPAGEDPRRGDDASISPAGVAQGKKDVLGLWIEQTEGAKFWLRVMTELKNRGVADALIVAGTRNLTRVGL